jgi:hypothetical protein
MALPNFFEAQRAAPVRGNRTATLTANGQIVLPAGVMLRRIYFRNRSGPAVTGGIRIGTTAGGTQIVTAQAIAANAIVSALPTIENYQVAAQTLFVEAVTSWAGAQVDVVVQYEEITTRTQPSDNNVQT